MCGWHVMPAEQQPSKHHSRIYAASSNIALRIQLFICISALIYRHAKYQLVPIICYYSVFFILPQMTFRTRFTTLAARVTKDLPANRNTRAPDNIESDYIDKLNTFVVIVSGRWCRELRVIFECCVC